MTESSTKFSFRPGPCQRFIDIMASYHRSVEADLEFCNFGAGSVDLDHLPQPLQTSGNHPEFRPEELQVPTPNRLQSFNNHLDGFVQSHPLPTADGNYAVSPVGFCRGTSIAMTQRTNEGITGVLELGSYMSPPTTLQMSSPHTTSQHHVCPNAGSGYTIGASLNHTTPPKGLVSAQRQSYWRNDVSPQKSDSM